MIDLIHHHHHHNFLQTTNSTVIIDYKHVPDLSSSFHRSVLCIQGLPDDPINMTTFILSTMIIPKRITPKHDTYASLSLTYCLLIYYWYFYKATIRLHYLTPLRVNV
jgi:hypothetical protein